MKDSEMSRRNRRGDAKDVGGEECERGVNPLSLRGLPQKSFSILVLSPAI